jgi:hypothetical protein
MIPSYRKSSQVEIKALSLEKNTTQRREGTKTQRNQLTLCVLEPLCLIDS